MRPLTLLRCSHGRQMNGLSRNTLRLIQLKPPFPRVKVDEEPGFSDIFPVEQDPADCG